MINLPQTPDTPEQTIEWKIPSTATLGTYRIRHDGDWKSGWDGVIRPYTGYSREFTVN